jgi:hypothetical protein
LRVEVGIKSSSQREVDVESSVTSTHLFGAKLVLGAPEVPRLVRGEVAQPILEIRIGLVLQKLLDLHFA